METMVATYLRCTMVTDWLPCTLAQIFFLFEGNFGKFGRVFLL